MNESKRDERRRAERVAERQRTEEIDRVLDEKLPPPFEAPAAGRFVQRDPSAPPSLGTPFTPPVREPE